MAPNPTLLSDDRLATDGIWASSRQHPVQHRHADGRLGLLSRKTAGAQTRSDQRFVAGPLSFLLMSVGRNRSPPAKPGGLVLRSSPDGDHAGSATPSPLGTAVARGGITTSIPSP